MSKIEIISGHAPASWLALVFLCAAAVQVSGLDSVLYVHAANPSPSAPYTNWLTAAMRVAPFWSRLTGGVRPQTAFLRPAPHPHCL